MRRRRTLAAALVATVLAAVGSSVGIAAQPASAAATTASVVVAPDDGGIVRSGKGIGVSVTVTNTGTAALGAGRLTVSLDKAPIANTAELLSAIAKPPQILQGQLTHTRADLPGLAVAETRTARTSISAKDLSDLLAVGGTSRLYVQYSADAGSERTRTIAVSSLVRIESAARASVGLGTVIPVLAPAGTSGIVDVQQQQTLAAPDGLWGRALQAAEADPSATIALDPAVLASIRIVGDTAPSEAVGFLDALGRLPNEFVRLPYADTDLTLARAAGVKKSLDPTSFAGITPASAAQGPTPAPTSAADTTSATATDLTAWNWSQRKVAWPVPGTTGAAALTGLAKNGTEVLLSSNDVDTAGRNAVPLARIGSAALLVSDATASSLLESASAEGPAADAALATLTGVLATDAVSGEAGGVLATIGRSGAPARLDRVLRLLDRQSWIRPSTLSDLGSIGSAGQVKLRQHAVKGTLIGTARSLLDGEAEVQQLGTAITSGADTVTAPQRLTLLGAMSAAWRGDDGWRTAAGTAEQGFTKLVGQVRLAKQSSPNLVGGDGTLRVYVDNALSAPIRVVVHAGVSNGAVQFTNASDTVVVPAGGSAKADLGFRSIRNGQTDLTLSLTTPNGTPIGTEVNRGATVRAGFDTIVAVVLLTALGLLLALGVYRNVKRRRQPRTAAE